MTELVELTPDLDCVAAVDAVRARLDALGSDAKPDAVLALRVTDPAMGDGWRLLACGRLLAMRLAHSWMVHGRPPPPVDLRGDPAAAARRRVATHCLYGLSPERAQVTAVRALLEDWAVDRGTPPISVDHAIRRGDPALGFTLDQLAAFSPHADAVAHRIIGPRLRQLHAAHLPLRAAVLALAPWDAQAARAALRVADDHNDVVRVIGDVLAGWTLGSRADRPGEGRRRLDLIVRWLTERPGDAEARLRRMQAAVRRRWATFHWQSEFSELGLTAAPLSAREAA